MGILNAPRRVLALIGSPVVMANDKGGTLYVVDRGVGGHQVGVGTMFEIRDLLTGETKVVKRTEILVVDFKALARRYSRIDSRMALANAIESDRINTLQRLRDRRQAFHNQSTNQGKLRWPKRQRSR
jgi:hypothetical protein